MNPTHKTPDDPQASMPQVLRDVQMHPGTTTLRKIEFCEQDWNHTVISDCWARWDAVLQQHVHDSDLGQCSCNECDGPVMTDTLHIENKVAIQALRADLRATSTAVAGMIQQGPDGRDWKTEICPGCGEDYFLIDSYGSYDPVLQRGELVTTFDKGHTCGSCGYEGRPETHVFSQHERLDLLAQMQERRAMIEDSIVELDGWLVAHGDLYGLDAETRAAIAAEQTVVQVAATGS